jgi:hypothetical protein
MFMDEKVKLKEIYRDFKWISRIHYNKGDSIYPFKKKTNKYINTKKLFKAKRLVEKSNCYYFIISIVRILNKCRVGIKP